jgi:hypothetical protein
MELKRIAIDTSKHVFTMHGVDRDDRVVLRRELRRVHVAAFFAKLSPTEVVLEACAGSHHWGRLLTGLGHRALGSGLQLLGSECRDWRCTVWALGQGSTRCPGCDARSTLRHGWQVRHLQDLPARDAGDAAGASGAMAMPKPTLRASNLQRPAFPGRWVRIPGSCRPRFRQILAQHSAMKSPTVPTFARPV